MSNVHPTYSNQGFCRPLQCCCSVCDIIYIMMEWQPPFNVIFFREKICLCYFFWILILLFFSLWTYNVQIYWESSHTTYKLNEIFSVGVIKVFFVLFFMLSHFSFVLFLMVFLLLFYWVGEFILFSFMFFFFLLFLFFFCVSCVVCRFVVFCAVLHFMVCLTV